MTLITFRNYGLPNTWLDNCLERIVSEDCSSDNMVNGSKYCFSFATVSPYLLITVKIIQFEKVSLSDMQNIKTVC